MKNKELILSAIFSDGYVIGAYILTGDFESRVMDQNKQTIPCYNKIQLVDNIGGASKPWEININDHDKNKSKNHSIEIISENLVGHCDYYVYNNSTKYGKKITYKLAYKNTTNGNKAKKLYTKSLKDNYKRELETLKNTLDKKLNIIE